MATLTLEDLNLSLSSLLLLTLLLLLLSCPLSLASLSDVLWPPAVLRRRCGGR
jgi:hypothetical protein